MKVSFRIEQEFGLESPAQPIDIGNRFKKITQQLDIMLETKKKWYEKGYSRKQALEHQVFTETGVSDSTITRWDKEYKKSYPFFGEGIWDGGTDENSVGINCYSSYSSTNRRAIPMRLTITFPEKLTETNLTVDKVITFLHFLLSINDDCTYLNVESASYSFSKVVVEGNRYSDVFKKVFPDRIAVGWMLYIPAIILPELIPEAARVVPVMNGDKQKGTLIISTEEVFDGNKKEHIEKSNDIEIKLLDLGCLPLVTEL